MESECREEAHDPSWHLFACFRQAAVFRGFSVGQHVDTTTGPIKDSFGVELIQVFARDSQRLKVTRTQDTSVSQHFQDLVTFGIGHGYDWGLENVGS